MLTRAIQWLLFLAFLGHWSGALGQDPHFSQYFASPLTLNPVNTGYFDGDYRIAANFRQQWFNARDAYNTSTVSYDVKLMKPHVSEFTRVGIGVMGMFDESLGGVLRSTYVSVSGAYHKALAFDGKHTVGVGFQVTFANRTIDYSRLTFASQFNGLGFDTALPNNLTIADKSIEHLDMNAGVLYALHSKGLNAYVGASLYHISQPQESLFNEVETKLNHRYNLHSAAEFSLDDLNSISVSGLYMKQGNVSETLFGGVYKLQSTLGKNNASLFVGVWHRLRDALIPYIGVDYKDIHVGINYEVAITNAYYNKSSYALKPQTVEVSVIFRKRSITNPAGLCPRF
ncbi:MAG TPA: PorP/SprF family type IX secretion system membrane protein [Sphingobacteriaceae bacterium]